MKRIRVKLAAMLLILLFLTSCGSVAQQAQNAPGTPAVSAPPSGTYPGKPLLSADKIHADARQLVSVIESTHPAFSLNDIPPGYEAAKEAFLSAAAADMTVHDFTWLVSAYLTSLKDGHTSVEIYSSNEYLDISVQAAGDKLYLLDENGKQTGQYIVSINDIPMTQVFDAVGKYFSAENEAAADHNNTLWALNKDVLCFAGLDRELKQAAVTIQDGNMTMKKDVAFVMGGPVSEYDYTSVINNKMIGDVLYLDFNICEPGAQISKACSALKEAQKSGVTKVIIDVRNNPGGNSSACVDLLEAMGMEPPQYGMYVRYSSMTKKYGQSSGFDEYEPHADTAKQNPAINLVVLTNYNTYSSATMLAVFVQDGKLGKIIGQPSTNSPSCYGDILAFALENSYLTIHVSFKKFLRPDINADQQTLQPDIAVPLGEDVVQAALDYLKYN